MNIEHPDELRAYLLTQFPRASDQTIETRTLAGGVSNRTVLVRIGNDDGIVLKQALPKLRVEVDWHCDPARIHREAAGLRALGQLLPPGATPRFLFEDPAEHLLAMSEVPEPYENWKTRLLHAGPSQEHVATAAKLLAAMHRGAAKQQDKLRRDFEDRSFFEALRLEPYYGFAAEQLPEAADFLRRLQADTRARTLTLVHGDFSPKNILLRPDAMVLLDHEVIHWGDPAFDVGFFLAHLLSKAHHVPPHRADFLSAAVDWWRGYFEGLGSVPWRDGLEQAAVRHTLGCLLARVRGRSPLEYLTPIERDRQAAAVLPLTVRIPESIASLTGAFAARLE